MKMGAASTSKLSNGGGLVVVNADGSITITPASGTGVLLGVAPPATANRALFQIGNAPIDGTSAGHYVGGASGGGYGANFASGYAGDLINLQVAGVSKLNLGSSGGTYYFGGPDVIRAARHQSPGGSNSLPSIIMELQAAGQVGDGWQVKAGSTVFAGCRSDGLIYGTTAGLATKVKAGIPADADWAVAPPDGTIIGDSTDSKIYIRLGSTWKAVVVA